MVKEYGLENNIVQTTTPNYEISEEGNVCIGDLSFVMTCSQFPEQYDVFDKSGKQVAYVRMREDLRCDYPEHGGKTIYEVNPDSYGFFDSDEERLYYLEEIAWRIKDEMDFQEDQGRRRP